MMNRRFTSTVVSLRARALSGVAALALVCFLVPSGHVLAQDAGQDTYESADAAIAAFTTVFQAGEVEPMRKVFGSAISTFTSGDDVQDKTEIAKVSKAVKENVRSAMINPKHAVLYIGALNWPFPIPLVQNAAGRWYFDTAAGREEYLNRRIGRNEIATMGSLHAIANAQIEYAAEDRDGDGVIEYAQRFLSSEGLKDGLFWRTAEGEPKSPVGELVATLKDEGYVAGSASYRGYRYALLTSQGPAAVGGTKEYLVDGNLVRGFAVVAWPVSWGASGVMTFMIGPDGRIFEKNLGPKTGELATAMKTFNPDSSWKLSKE